MISSAKPRREFPQENFIRVFRYYVENYRIYYVLNKFNSIAESVETTIRPFVENIFRSVSSRLNFHNLGWLVQHDDITRSSETGDALPGPPPLSKKAARGEGPG